MHDLILTKQAAGLLNTKTKHPEWLDLLKQFVSQETELENQGFIQIQFEQQKLRLAIDLRSPRAHLIVGCPGIYWIDLSQEGEILSVMEAKSSLKNLNLTSTTDYEYVELILGQLFSCIKECGRFLSIAEVRKFA